MDHLKLFFAQKISIRCVNSLTLTFSWKRGSAEMIQNIIGGKMVELAMQRRKRKGRFKPEKWGLQKSDIRRMSAGGVTQSYEQGRELCRPGPVSEKERMEGAERGERKGWEERGKVKERGEGQRIVVEKTKSDIQNVYCLLHLTTFSHSCENSCMSWRAIT